MKRIQFGIGHDFRNLDPARRPWAEVYRQGIDRVAYADELGYDYMFIGEHHFTEDGHAPSLFPLFASIASATTQIRLNTYVFLLPLHHPLNVAEDVIAVDLLSNGRMELGVGLGYRADEFGAFGVDRRRRGSIMEESCAILIKAWTEQGWSFHGRHFTIDEVTLVPGPVQRPHPRLWISARNERAARRAARFRAPLMIAPAPYTQDPVRVYAAYAQALQDDGEDPASYDVMGSFNVHVLAPGEQPSGGAGNERRYRQYIDWYTKDGDLPDDASRIASPSELLQRYIGVTGEAPACVEAIEALLTRVPFTTLMVGGLGRTQLERFSAGVATEFGEQLPRRPA